MTLIEFPRPVQLYVYEQVLERMVRKLSGTPGVCCIYQIGHVSNPGISDLDLLVVFDSTSEYLEDPRSDLDSLGRYLFAHGLFGVREEDFSEATRLSSFHNYQLRWGKPPAGHFDLLQLQNTEQAELKRQVALEYMMRIYTSLFVEMTYGILKVRNALLHAKALLYDCEFLGIQEGRFRDAAQKLVRRRNAWFDEPIHAAELKEDVAYLCETLGQTLNLLFKTHCFFVPTGYRNGGFLAPHIQVRPGTDLCIRHSGVKLPAMPAILSRKYVNLLHRLNRFDVRIPLTSEGAPTVIREALNLRTKLAAVNRQFFPKFMSLCSNFSLQ